MNLFAGKNTFWSSFKRWYSNPEFTDLEQCKIRPVLDPFHPSGLFWWVTAPKKTYWASTQEFKKFKPFICLSQSSNIPPKLQNIAKKGETLQHFHPLFLKASETLKRGSQTSTFNQTFYKTQHIHTIFSVDHFHFIQTANVFFDSRNIKVLLNWLILVSK